MPRNPKSTAAVNIGTSENAKTAVVIAKEFVAAQTDEPGVLLLSKFCGAAETMQRAIIINPYDLQNIAAAIVEALEMPLEERIARRDDLDGEYSRVYRPELVPVLLARHHVGEIV